MASTLTPREGRAHSSSCFGMTGVYEICKIVTFPPGDCGVTSTSQETLIIRPTVCSQFIMENSRACTPHPRQASRIFDKSTPHSPF